MPPLLTLQDIVKFNEIYLAQAKAYSNPTYLHPGNENVRSDDFGAVKLDLITSDKNYLLVPLKLCSKDILKYKIDVDSVLQMIGKKQTPFC